MKTRTVTIARVTPGFSTVAYCYRPNCVTLPAEPWGYLPPPDDTAPRSAPIRGDFDWRKDPVLRSAAKKAGAA